MTDPVQVVAEALWAHRGPFDKGAWRCSCGERFDKPYHTTAAYESHVNEAIVAALKAAGALMPDMAEQMLNSRDEAIAYWVRQVGARDVRLDELDALLQEVREVLGRAHAELEMLRLRGLDEVKPDELIGCGPLLQKIDQATKGEG